MPTFLISLNFLDIVVLGLSVLLTLMAIVLGGLKEKQRGAVDLILMGRRLTLPFFIASLVTSSRGSMSFLTSESFERGIRVLFEQFFLYLAFLFFAFFMVKRIRALQVMTVPDLVRAYYGRRAGRLAAIFNIFHMLPMAYALAIGLLLQSILGGELYQNILIALLGAGVYAAFGGLRADVYSDMIQFVLIISSVILLPIFLCSQYGGIDFLSSRLPQAHWQFFSVGDLSDFFVLLLSGLSILVNPILYQRCFAAASDRAAKRGVLISILCWVIFDLSLCVVGLYARAVLPDADPNSAYLTLAVQVLPDGFRGLFLAGILATIISALDSLLLISGTSISYDLLGHRKSSIQTHQAFILAVSLATFLIALSFGSEFQKIWSMLGSYWAGCLLVPILLPIFFRKRFPGYAFIISSLISVMLMTLWRQLDLPENISRINEIYIGILVSIVTYLWARGFEVWRGARLRRGG